MFSKANDMKSSFFSTVLLTLGIFICISAQGQTKGKAKAKTSTFTLNKSLVGKWVAGTLEKGMWSLVLGENGTGTFTAACDKKMGDGDYCHCNYSSKVIFTWKTKGDSLFVLFASTANEIENSSVAPGTEDMARRMCLEMSCDMIMRATFGTVNSLKGTGLKDAYVLAGNTLDFAGAEYRKE